VGGKSCPIDVRKVKITYQYDVVLSCVLKVKVTRGKSIGE